MATRTTTRQRRTPFQEPGKVQRQPPTDTGEVGATPPPSPPLPKSDNQERPKQLVIQTMSAEELNLLSGLWKMLMIVDCEHGWPVRNLMTWCCPLVNASYLEPDAEGRFRRFVRERPSFFEYDSKLDSVRVAKNSPHAAIERCLVKYLTLQILGGHCDVGAEASDRCQSALPNYMAAHLNTIYGGSLRLFCKAHPSDFTLDSNGTHLVRLTVGCRERIMASYRREGDLVYFFVDLLHKIGATMEKPCPGHTLRSYLDFMRSNDRRLLFENYRDNLDVFFLLNPANFGMTRAENGSVYLRNRDPHYAAALFLRQHLQIQGTSVVSLKELVFRAKYTSSPVTQYLFGARTAERTVRKLVWGHPALFHINETGNKLRLRIKCPSGRRWNSDAELLAVAHFIHILKDIGATSPSRAICFNYIICAASAAPPKCKGYLVTVYPRLEVIGLFHLHPSIFDLSSVNRVSLHTKDAPETLPTKLRSEQQIEKQAVEFAAKLIKYVCRLTPELFRSCTEGLPRDVRQYCEAPVKGRLQSIIESGRAVLATNVPRTVISATSEASTQTATAPTSLPLMCQPAKEAAKNNKQIHRNNQKTTTEVFSPSVEAGSTIEAMNKSDSATHDQEGEASSSLPR
ncbi:hypothetical protein HPB49_005355 [Dermacentor silvarum]|uniref:Uncharacterized protein n=1 Tax=Dermacentor silvarum TaxID=543639 RepID=A0ACB8DV30_DERSI|nr:hypothetical protein HPB49_005355 [Dermacentor silvarum]